MASFRVFKAKLSGLFLRAHLSQRLDEELQAHMDLPIAEETSRGVSIDEARRRARLRLGGLDQTRESVRDARAFWLEPWWKDVRYGLRRLISTALFSVFSIFTLALGIGATTSIYSVIHSVLGRHRSGQL